MSIPTMAELLRRPDHPAKPTPAEIFAPHLLPGEDLLWASQPNAERYKQQNQRTSIIYGGIGIAVCATLGIQGLMTNGATNTNIMLLVCILPLLMCLLHGYSATPDPQFYAVTTVRLLNLYSNHEDPFSALPLSKVQRVSLSAIRNGCGSVRFNVGLFVLQNIGSFVCVDNAETVASLILDAKRKAPPGSAGL